MTWLWRFIS